MEGQETRICSDFKETNKCVKNMSYQLPTLDNILSKLQGVLDLNQAYLQLELDEESQKLLVLNTP